MAGQVLFANSAWGQLSTAIASTDLTITLQSGQGARFPLIATGSGNWFYVTLIDSSNNLEICKVTVTSGDQFTVTRGVDGSTPRAFAASSRVELRTNAAYFSDLQAQIQQAQTTLQTNLTALITELNTQMGVGMIMMWSGSIATIPSGWHLCDGTAGTIDLRDRFVVGAGISYTVGVTGGSATNTLSVANLPAHNHPISDPGHAHATTQSAHAHAINDPGHAHAVADPGHYHGFLDVNGNPISFIGTNNGGFSIVGGSNAQASNRTTAVTTGIGIYGSTTGIGIYGNTIPISINGATTGITTTNTGSGTAVNNLPPYYALAYIQRTGTW